MWRSCRERRDEPPHAEQVLRRSGLMRMPRRWMATFAAVALISTLAMPADAVMIRYYQPPGGEEYVGDPNIPDGGAPMRALRYFIALPTPVGVLLIPLPMQLTRVALSAAGRMETVRGARVR